MVRNVAFVQKEHMLVAKYRSVCQTQGAINSEIYIHRSSGLRNSFVDSACGLLNSFRGAVLVAFSAFLILPKATMAQTVVIDNQPVSVSAPFAGVELQFFSLDGTARPFEVPSVFGSVLRVGTAVSLSPDSGRLDEVLRNDAFRRELYRSAILATLAAPSLSRLEPSAASGLSRTGSSDLAASLVEITAAAAGTAGSLGEALQAIDNTLETPTLSTLGRDAAALGILSLGVQIVSDIRSTEERARIIAEAAADAELVFALKSIGQLLSTQRNHDPAMVAAISDAVADIEVLSGNRLRRMGQSAVTAVEQATPDIAAFLISQSFSAGPAIVAREVMALHGVVDDFAERALLVAAQHTIASHIQPLLLAVLDDGASFDGLDRSSLPMAELIWFQTRLTADASAATYTALWEDRWSHPLSLGALSRGAGLLIAETRAGRRDLRSIYRAEVADRAAMHHSVFPITGSLAPVEPMAAFEADARRIDPWVFLERITTDLPEGFSVIQENKNSLMIGYFDDSLPGARLDTVDGDSVILMTVGREMFGRPFLEERADELQAEGYSARPVLINDPTTADIARTLSMARPVEGAPRKSGLIAFERAISIYLPLPEDGNEGISILLAGYRMDEPTSAVYDAAAEALSNTLRVTVPGEAGNDAAPLTSQDWIQPDHLLLEGHAGSIWSVRFSPDGSQVMSTAEDGRVLIFDPQTGRRGMELRVGRRWVEDAIYAPDGTRIVTLERAGEARYWDANTGRRLFGLHDYHGEGMLAFSPDGAKIVTPSGRSVQIRDSATGRVKSTLTGHQGRVMALQVSPDGSRLVTGSADRTVRLWQMSTGRIEHSFGPLPAVINDVAFSPDGTLVAAAPSNSASYVWRVSDGALIHQFDGGGGLVIVRFSPDGARLLTGTRNGTIRIWDIDSGSLQTEFLAGPTNLQDAAFSPSGDVVATGAMRGDARIWDARTGELIADLNLRQAGNSRVAFSPDGKMLAVTTGGEGAAALWAPRK